MDTPLFVNRLSLAVALIALAALASKPLGSLVSWRGHLPESRRDAVEVRPGTPHAGVLRSGRPGDHVLGTREGALYTVDVSSSSFDPVLTIESAREGVLRPEGRDDDGGEGRNSRLVLCAPSGGIPLLLAVSAFGSEGTGDYTLRVTEGDGSGYCDPGGDPVELLPPGVRDAPEVLVGGPSLTGRITDDQETRRYWFRADPRQQLRIDVTSAGSDLDPVATLHVATPSGLTELERDDDGGEGRNSRIETCTGGWYAPHVVEVSRYSGTGRFELTVVSSGECSN